MNYHIIDYHNLLKRGEAKDEDIYINAYYPPIYDVKESWVEPIHRVLVSIVYFLGRRSSQVIEPIYYNIDYLSYILETSEFTIQKTITELTARNWLALEKVDETSQHQFVRIAKINTKSMAQKLYYLVFNPHLSWKERGLYYYLIWQAKYNNYINYPLQYLAEKLCLSKPTLKNMVDNLTVEGFLHYDYNYKLFHLTKLITFQDIEWNDDLSLKENGALITMRLLCNNDSVYAIPNIGTDNIPNTLEEKNFVKSIRNFYIVSFL
ncbi:MAG TPA: hypothetical protein ENO30_05605 [Thermodesulfobium narugense]|nr:hypothetical protein [Thermodesulfobium narugense]